MTRMAGRSVQPTDMFSLAFGIPDPSGYAKDGEL